MGDPRPHPAKRRIPRIELGAHGVERDVDAELAFHLEMRVRTLVARGLDPAAARAQALRQFGDWDAVRAECLDIDYEKERAVKRANYFQELRQDAAYALRSLRHNAGFALVVVLSLALGIGANTAIFTLLDAVLLRTLPVPNADRLVVIGDPARVNGASIGTPRTDLFSYSLYRDVRDRNRLVTGLAATGRTGRLDVVIDDRPGAGAAGAEPEHPRGRLVTGNYFEVLGVPAFAGRTFTADEDRAPNGAPVAVISHAYWQRRFAGDRGVVGRTVHINGTPFTIIGVAPPGFHGEVVGRMTDLWLPVTMQPAIMHDRDWLSDRGASWLLLIGRLAPGVTLAQARAGFTTLTLQAIDAAAQATGPRTARADTVAVGSGARGLSSVRRVYGESLATLMAVVGLVLLVVCANVANLLLARGAARGRELGVRMALGAGRTRLVRQLLTESVILSALGGVVGLLLAAWGSRALLVLASGGPTPIPLDIGLDWRVVAFTGAVTVLTAVLFGLVPAMRATRVDPMEALRYE
jgi:predicted permease